MVKGSFKPVEEQKQNYDQDVIGEIIKNKFKQKTLWKKKVIDLEDGGQTVIAIIIHTHTIFSTYIWSIFKKKPNFRYSSSTY